MNEWIKEWIGGMIRIVRYVGLIILLWNFSCIINQASRNEFSFPCFLFHNLDSLRVLDLTRTVYPLSTLTYQILNIQRNVSETKYHPPPFDNCCQRFSLTYKPYRFVITFNSLKAPTFFLHHFQTWWQFWFSFPPSNPPRAQPSTCLDPISSQLLITLASNSLLLLRSSLIYFHPRPLPQDHSQLCSSMLAFAFHSLHRIPSALSSTTPHKLFCY